MIDTADRPKSIRDDACAYILDMLEQLAAMAEQNGLTELAERIRTVTGDGAPRAAPDGMR